MNLLQAELKGRKVVVKDGCYEVGPSEADRTFMCVGGFGCFPFAMGQAVIGYFVTNPKVKGRIEGRDIEKFAEEETV